MLNPFSHSTSAYSCLSPRPSPSHPPPPQSRQRRASASPSPPPQPSPIVLLSFAPSILPNSRNVYPVLRTSSLRPTFSVRLTPVSLPNPHIYCNLRPTSPPNPLPPDDTQLILSTSPPPHSHADHPALQPRHTVSYKLHHDQSSRDESPFPASFPSAQTAEQKIKIVSNETRRKISYSLLGRPKSEEMRAKVSAALKGRQPWNKGKKMSPETRARMSQARIGREAWNKGRRLSKAHREAISLSGSNCDRSLTGHTRFRMRLAHRRPGDSLVSGSAGRRPQHGTYALIDSSEINEYVSLRRELRVWSDRFISVNGRRPSLADVRRLASVPIMRKFEMYVAMRDRIRGLAGDVYGDVDPDEVPVVPSTDVTNSPSNNNAISEIHVTKHGNQRLAKPSSSDDDQVWNDKCDANLIGALDDMWDAYDRPITVRSSPPPEEHAAENSLIGPIELLGKKTDQFSANDFRKIGRHRLMEVMDINRYVRMRKELESWSSTFKKQFGRTPTLSDARLSDRSGLYSKFCTYLKMRERMSGLVKEVYGTEVDDVETLSKFSAEGKEVLDTLRASSEPSDHLS